MTEVWKDIPGFEGRYQASTAGNVRGLDRDVQQTNRWGQLITRIERGREFKLKADKDGYLHVSSQELPTVCAHRLVALTFIANPESKPQVNHKNGVVSDNRTDNLEWCTNSENHVHAYRELGRKHNTQPGKPVALAKANFIKVFSGVRDAAEFAGVVKTSVMNAARTGGKCRGFEVAYV